MKRRQEIEEYGHKGWVINSYYDMRKYAIELETELEASQATIRALQASNHVIFN